MELLNISPLGLSVLTMYLMGIAFVAGVMVGTWVEHGNARRPDHYTQPPSSGSPAADRCNHPNAQVGVWEDKMLVRWCPDCYPHRAV